MPPRRTLELTEQEVVALEMKAAGKKPKEIAAALGVSRTRVVQLLSRAMRKSVAKERLALQNEARKLR